jgi:CBS domain containing-hemolysin-like protein
VRRTRLQELSDEGSRRAKQVLGLTAVPPRFIAAMQLGHGHPLAIGPWASRL